MCPSTYVEGCCWIRSLKTSKGHFELALITDASALKRSLIAEGCGSFIPQSHEHRGLSLELDGEQANGTLEKTETSFYFAL